MDDKIEIFARNKNIDYLENIVKEYSIPLSPSEDLNKLCEGFFIRKLEEVDYTEIQREHLKYLVDEWTKNHNNLSIMEGNWGVFHWTLGNMKV